LASVLKQVYNQGMDIKSPILSPLQTTSSDQERLPKVSLHFLKLVEHIFFILIVSGILVYIRMPISIVVIIGGFEIVSSCVFAIVEYLKLKSIPPANSTEQKSFKDLLIMRANTQFLNALIVLCFSILAVVVVASFFGNTLLNLGNIHGYARQLLILIFIVFRFVVFVLRLGRYFLVKNIHERENTLQINQKYTIIEKKFSLLTFSPEIIAFLTLSLFFGVPLLIFGILLVCYLIFAGVLFFQLKQLTEKDLSQQNVANRAKKAILIEAEEKLVGTVFGIMNYKKAEDQSPVMNKTTNPENTLLLTDKRLLLIQIPVLGGNNIIGDTTYSTADFFWNRSEMKEKGLQMIEHMSLGDIAKQYGMRDFVYSQIEKIVLKKMEIIITTLNGQETAYLFMDAEYVDPLKKQLTTYKKEKFVQTE